MLNKKRREFITLFGGYMATRGTRATGRAGAAGRRAHELPGE